MSVASASVDPYHLQAMRSSDTDPRLLGVPSPETSTKRGPGDSFHQLPTASARLSATLSRNVVRNVHPSLNIKFSTHEEVVSVAKPQSGSEGASECAFRGTLYAMVESSDPVNNHPFLIPLDILPETVQVHPHDEYASYMQPDPSGDNNSSNSSYILVQIPKPTIGFVPVLHYTCHQLVDHMPILLERKVTLHGDVCRVAAQVRSKLTNLGDMEEFTIAIAIPPTVDPSTVEILRGDGDWNQTQRVIKFTLPKLVLGESFMVSAEMKLWPTQRSRSMEDLVFPILLRCSSINDPICDIPFQAVAVQDSPCALTVKRGSAFRLLHRLP